MTNKRGSHKCKLLQIVFYHMEIQFLFLFKGAMWNSNAVLEAGCWCKQILFSKLSFATIALALKRDTETKLKKILHRLVSATERDELTYS